MREIKFRAWDKNTETMDEFIYDLNFKNDELHKEIHLYHDEILMQYTGLKDKNGVEIYEGDIVKYYQAEYNEDTYLHEDKITSAEWYEDAYALIRYTEHAKHITPFPLARMKKLEVIGNIYENPELLKDTHE